MGAEASALARSLRAACCKRIHRQYANHHEAKREKGKPKKPKTHLALKVSLTLDLPLLLEPVNNILVVPSDLGANPLDGAVLPSGLQSEDTESGGDDHLLDSVLGGGDTLVKLESLEGGGTSRALVGDHTADSLVEDSGRSTEVEGTRLPGVDNVSL